MSCLVIVYALDDPKISSNDWIKRLFFFIDLGIWIFFILEIVLRVLLVKYIDGLQAFHLLSIFFDSLILIMGIFNFVGYSQTTFGMVSKCLKVVVVFTKIPFVKHIVKYLLLSIRPIIGIYVYLVVAYLCFAVVFVRYEGGKNHYCTTENIPTAFIYPNMDRAQCVDLGGDWVNYGINFDDVYQAWRTLFVMSTGDGWVNQMWKDFDNNGIMEYERQKELVGLGSMRWIYIVFMCLFYFCLLDVFTGTIIQEYYKQKNTEFGIGQLNPQQLHWVYLQKMILDAKPKIKFKTRNICGFLSSNFFSYHKTKFELLQLMIYMAFMIIWSTASYPMDTTSAHYQVISAAYNLFLGVWLIEILMTIYIKRLKYFKSLFKWIELGHFAGCIVLFVTIYNDYGVFSSKTVIDSSNVRLLIKMKQNDHIIQSFRLLLILRALTAVRFFYNITLFKKIIRIFLYILPAFTGMIILILVIIFIFSCIGFYAFTYVSFGPDGNGISQNANFSTFLTSFATLFRICFADNWSSILESLTAELMPNHICFDFDNSHDNYLKYGLTKCGSRNAGFVYLYLFYTAVNFIFFNILIALVLDSFEVAYQQEATTIQRPEVDHFVDTWKEFDHSALSMIKVDQIIPLLKALNYPLSLQKNFKQEQKLRYLIAKLVLPLYTKNGEKVKGLWDVPVKRPTIRMVVELTTKQELYYNFHDVLLALAHNSLVSNDSREYKEIINKKVVIHYELDQTRIRNLTKYCGGYTRIPGWSSKNMFSIHLVKKNLNRLALILRSGKKVAFTDYDETLKRTIKESSIESGSVTKMSKDLRSKLKQPDTVEVSEYKKQESFHSDKSSPEKLKSSRNWILENENEQPPMPIIILPIVDGKDFIPNEETVIHPDESAPLGHSQSSPIKKTEELTIEVVEEGQRGEVKPPSPKNWEI